MFLQPEGGDHSTFSEADTSDVADQGRGERGRGEERGRRGERGRGRRRGVGRAGVGRGDGTNRGRAVVRGRAGLRGRRGRAGRRGRGGMQRDEEEQSGGFNGAEKDSDRGLCDVGQ